MNVTDPAVGAAALRQAGIGAVGIANNVNYGETAWAASHSTPATAAAPTAIGSA